MKPKPLRLSRGHLIGIAVVASIIGLIAWSVLPDIGDTPEIGDPFTAAVAAQKAREYQYAIKLYTEVIQQDSSRVAAYLHRAECYGELKQFDQMTADIEQVLKLDQKNADALELRAKYADSIDGV